MTATTDLADLRDTSLITDADLVDALAALFGTAHREQMWWLFLDSGDRLQSPFMPSDGWPRDPYEIVATHDLGERAIAEVLAIRLASLMTAVSAARVVLVWERPRVRRAAHAADAWAAAMADALAAQGVDLRAQALLARDGIRLLDPSGP